MRQRWCWFVAVLLAVLAVLPLRQLIQDFRSARDAREVAEDAPSFDIEDDLDEDDAPGLALDLNTVDRESQPHLSSSSILRDRAPRHSSLPLTRAPRAPPISSS